MLKPEFQLQFILEKEIAEAFSTYRMQFTLFTQLLTVVAVANVTIIGFAISSKNLNILFIGSACPILILLIKIRSEQLMFPIVYSAYHLEQKLGFKNIDWLAGTYISTFVESHDKILWQINQKKTQEERMAFLKERCRVRHYKLFSKQRFISSSFIFLCCAIQLFIPLYV